jgi:hypothetical protein
MVGEASWREESKTVIDACNPIGGGPPINGVLSYFTTLTVLLQTLLLADFPYD